MPLPCSGTAAARQRADYRCRDPASAAGSTAACHVRPPIRALEADDPRRGAGATRRWLRGDEATCGDDVLVSQPSDVRVCGACHRPLAPTEAARKDADGQWTHVTCPSDAEYAKHMAALRPRRPVPSLPFRVDTPSPGVVRGFLAAMWLLFAVVGLGMMTDSVAFGSVFAGVFGVLAVRAARCGVVVADANGVVARTTYWTYRWPWERIDHFSAETRLVGQMAYTRRVLCVYFKSGKSKWLMEIAAKESNASPVDDAALDLNAVNPDRPTAPSSESQAEEVSASASGERPAPLMWVPVACVAAAASIAILVAGPDWLWGAAVIPVAAARGFYLRLRDRASD